MKGHDLISRFTKESIAVDPLNECLLSGGARVTLETYSHSRQLLLPDNLRRPTGDCTKIEPWKHYIYV